MDINELLRSVTSLFSKVSLLDLQKRTALYKQQGNRNLQQDITTPLFDCIDKLAASNPARAPISIQSGNNEQPATEINQEPAQVTSTQVETTDTVSTDLSNYFKSHSSHSDSASYLGDKLKASTWSHIHTAILKAREGDAKTARLHADIANQAMKEASHYMSDEDFKVFAEEIEHALSELKQQSS